MTGNAGWNWLSGSASQFVVNPLKQRACQSQLTKSGMTVAPMCLLSNFLPRTSPQTADIKDRRKPRARRRCSALILPNCREVCTLLDWLFVMLAKHPIPRHPPRAQRKVLAATSKKRAESARRPHFPICCLSKKGWIRSVHQDSGLKPALGHE